MTDKPLDPRRGIFLLSQMREAQQKLSSLPSVDVDKLNAALEDLQHRERGIVSRLVSMPSGVALYFFYELAEGGRLTFPDTARSREYESVGVVTELFDKYGKPGNLAAQLTEEASVELLEAALADAKAYEYVKYLCAAELAAGKQLPAPLLMFSGIAILQPTPPVKRGRRKTTNELRDSIICTVAKHLAGHFNLPLSRGYGSSSDSICSIISDAMDAYGHSMTEEAIRKVIEKDDRVADSQGGFGKK